MDLAIAATLFAVFVIGFGSVRVLFERPGMHWARSTIVEGTIVMTLTTVLSFALALTFNFFATRSEQTFGALEFGWTVVAVVLAVLGAWFLHPRKPTAPVNAVGDGSAPASSASNRESKPSRAA